MPKKKLEEGNPVLKDIERKALTKTMRALRDGLSGHVKRLERARTKRTREQYSSQEVKDLITKLIPGETTRVLVGPWFNNEDKALFLNNIAEPAKWGSWSGHRVYGNDRIGVQVTDPDGQQISLPEPTVFKWKDTFILNGAHLDQQPGVWLVSKPEVSRERVQEFNRLYLELCPWRGKTMEAFPTNYGWHLRPAKIDYTDALLDDTNQGKVDRIRQRLDNWHRLPTGKKRLGAVIYGPPGTGKSATISQLIKEYTNTGTTIMILRGGGVGDITRVYEWIQNMGRAVIVIEDFDTVGASRDARGQTTPMISVILNILDGERKYDVITIATTNYPEMLDQAIVRPGRLGLSIKFTAPDAKLRQRIIEHYAMVYNIPDIEPLNRLFNREGVLGAHIKEMCESILIEMLQGHDLEAACATVAQDYLSHDSIYWNQVERHVTGFNGH